MINYWPRNICFAVDGCNAACGICGVRKNTGAEMETDRMLEYIDEASELGMEKVDFTGGEPLDKRYVDVLECMRHASSKGMEVSVVTNASYARDPVTALRVAEDLIEAGAGYMCISFDKHHLGYVPMQNHVNAIRGATARGIKVNLYTTNINSTKDENMRLLAGLAHALGGECLPDHTIKFDGGEMDVSIRHAKRIGDAAMLPGSEFKNEMYSFECPTPSELVLKSRKIFPCCSFHSLDDEAYVVGTDENSLREAIDRTNESFMGNIVFGPSGMTRIRNSLKNSGHQKLARIASAEYLNVCEACKSFLTDRDSMDFLIRSFEKASNDRPVITFDGYMPADENAVVTVDGMKTKFLNYIGPVSVRNYYNSLFGHELRNIEQLEKKHNIDLSMSKDVIKSRIR